MTDKSPGYPWNWMAPKAEKPMTEAEKDRIYRRELLKRKQAVAKVNKNTFVGAYCGTTNSERAGR